MASQIITTARWTILSSKQGLPIGLCFPSAFSIHTRSTGGATYHCAPPLVQVPEVASRLAAYCAAVHLVHPRRTALTGLTMGFPQALTVDQVKHVVKQHRRRAFGLFGNFLELHGYGW